MINQCNICKKWHEITDSCQFACLVPSGISQEEHNRLLAEICSLTAEIQDARAYAYNNIHWKELPVPDSELERVDNYSLLEVIKEAFDRLTKELRVSREEGDFFRHELNEKTRLLGNATTELQEIDNILSRRGALDDLPNRKVKILHAIETAKHADKLKVELQEGKNIMESHKETIRLFNRHERENIAEIADLQKKLSDQDLYWRTRLENAWKREDEQGGDIVALHFDKIDLQKKVKFFDKQNDTQAKWIIDLKKKLAEEKEYSEHVHAEWGAALDEIIKVKNLLDKIERELETVQNEHDNEIQKYEDCKKKLAEARYEVDVLNAELEMAGAHVEGIQASFVDEKQRAEKAEAIIENAKKMLKMDEWEDDGQAIKES